MTSTSLTTSVNNVNDVNPQIKSNRFNEYIVAKNYVPRVLRNPSLAKKSRTLCFILRWGATEAGLELSRDGFAWVDELLELGQFANCTFDDIRRIVENDDKNRFTLTCDEGMRYKVRANHGHGIPGVNVIERELTSTEFPGNSVHLTTSRAWTTIEKEGLRTGRRNHIHFVGRIPSADEKVAGVREDANLCVFVNTKAAIEAGIPFSVTPSGVIVSPGNDDGCIPVEFIVKVTDRFSKEQVYPKTCQPPEFSLYDGTTAHVKSHDAYDNQFAYFVWAKFGQDQVDVLMLLDTGASITILPLQVFENIRDRPELHTTTVRIEVGNGANLTVNGVCRMKVQLGDYDFVHNFFICEDSTHAILGNDFIILQDITIRMRQGWLEFKGHDIPMFTAHGARARNRVFLAKAVSLPPLQEVEVPTYVRARIPSKRPQLFEPHAESLERICALAPRMMFGGDDCHPRVRLYNPTEQTVTVGVHRSLGVLHDVDDILVEATLSPEIVHRASSHLAKKAEPDDTTDRSSDDDAFRLPTGDSLEEAYRQCAKFVPEHIEQLLCDSVKDLSEEQMKMVTVLLTHYSDIFAKTEADIGKTHLITHDVDTGDARPVAQSVRRQSPEEYEAMVRIVDNLHKCGIIRPSRSEWAANIRMAKKKNGSWRMCIDYRDLNKRTIITDPYPLPRIDALMDTLGKGKVFCALDLISGYHQVPMTSRAQEKSAFITPQMSPSHWEYVYMPFGLTGAPATFQRLVDTMLRGIQYKNVLAYIDDIIVIGQTVEECCVHLAEVLLRIRRACLKLKPQKCELFKTQITYLGHVVSADGVQTDPKKVRAVAEWPVPVYVTDVRGFLGFCNYYRRYIRDYISITRPLNKLLCKDIRLVWKAEQTKSFKRLKTALSSAPLLAHPRDDCEYILDTDASAYGIGGVLSQLQPDCGLYSSDLEDTSDKAGDENGLVERPIAFHGRLLLPREMRYCVRRRELLAIYEMVQYFRCYLSGKPFRIRTDHDSLKGVKQLSKLTGQMARWIDFLEGFQFEVVVRPGKEHENADFLSRLYTDCFCKDREVFKETESAIEALENEPIQDWELFEKVCKEQANRRIRDRRSEIIHIHDAEALETLSDAALQEQIDLAAKLEGKEARQQIKRLMTVRVLPMLAPPEDSNEDDVEQWIPMWSKEEIAQAQADDEDLQAVYRSLSDAAIERPSWKDISHLGEACKFYNNEWSRLRLQTGLLYRLWESPDGLETWRQLVIPRVYQQSILQGVHSTTVGSHQGFRRTWDFLRRRFFWFEMGKQLRLFIRTCIDCQKKKNMNVNPRWPMTIFSVGFRNERVTLDMCGPIKFDRVPYSYLLVICDVFTKFVVAVPLRASSAVEIAQAFLDRWANVFGFPYHLHSDQGSNLTGELWREMCRLLRIERTRTTAYRPQSNGQNERTNKTIVSLLRTTQEKHEDWYKRVSHTCFAYNATPHASTGCSPYYLMFGCEPFADIDVRTPGDPPILPIPVNEHARMIAEHMADAHAEARRRLQESAETRKRFYDRGLGVDGNNKRVRTFIPGERVLLKISDHHMHYGKLNARFEGPYFVLTVFSNGTVRVKEEAHPTKPPKMVHHDRLRRFEHDESMETPAWVWDAIKAFERSKSVEVQTSDVDDDRSVSTNDSAQVACVTCKQRRVDKFGIYRFINKDLICHLCVKQRGDMD